jgi:hypothetical protein
MDFRKLQQEIVRIVDSLDESAVPMKPYAQTYARHIVQAAREAESYGDTPMKACKTQLLYVVSNLEGAPEITLRRVQRVATKYGIDIARVVDEVLHGDEEDEEDEESGRCPACGGDLIVLGSLGSRQHCRCRSCGMDSSSVKRGENPPPFPVVTAEEEMQRRQSDRIHEAIDAVMSDPKNAGAFDLHVAQTLARISDRLSMPGAERMLARHLAGRRTSNADVYVLRRELHNIANAMGADEIEMLFDDAFTVQARMATGHPVHHARANPDLTGALIAELVRFRGRKLTDALASQLVKALAPILRLDQPGAYGPRDPRRARAELKDMLTQHRDEVLDEGLIRDRAGNIAMAADTLGLKK